MDIDFKAFVARHIYDIVLIVVVGVKLIIQGTTDLRSKLIGLFFLLFVLYSCQVLSAKWLGPDTPIFWYVTAMIGMRLIALKVIYTVIDYDE